MNPPSAIRQSYNVIQGFNGQTKVLLETFPEYPVDSVHAYFVNAGIPDGTTKFDFENVELPDGWVVDEVDASGGECQVTIATDEGSYVGSVVGHFDVNGQQYEIVAEWDWLGRPIKVSMNDPHGGQTVDYPFDEVSGDYVATVPLGVQPYDIALFFVGDTSALALSVKSNLNQDVASSWERYAEGDNTRYVGRAAAGATDFPWSIALGSDYPSTQVVR